MFDLLLFSFFIFLALAMFAIGLFAKVPYPCMVAGGLFTIVGILTVANGLSIYNGAKNYTANYIDSTNTTLDSYNTVANYYNVDGNTKNALGMILIPIGLITAYQGILVGRVNKSFVAEATGDTTEDSA